MGRSGGQKRFKNRQLSFFNSEQISSVRPQTEYVPGPDHKQLVFDAVEIWVQDPRYLLDGDADKEWSKFLGENKLINRSDPNYWQQAKEALLYQARNSAPDSAPIFRGQPFLASHPFDRARGWSPSLDTVFDFIIDHLLIEDESQVKEINLHAASKKARDFLSGKSQKDIFSDGGELTAAVYLIENPETGFSVNSDFLREPRKKEALTQFENGNLNGSFYYLDEETSKWRTLLEAVDMIDLKSQTAHFISKQLERDEIIKHISFLPENIDIDHSPGYLIEAGSSIKDIEAMLEMIGDQEQLNNWREETDRIREVLQSKNNISYGIEDCYLDENEVIVPPESTSKMRRVEVIVASSSAELADLSASDVQRKIQAAIDSRDFINPDDVAPGQKRLFSLN